MSNISQLVILLRRKLNGFLALSTGNCIQKPLWRLARFAGLGFDKGMDGVPGCDFFSAAKNCVFDSQAGAVAEINRGFNAQFVVVAGAAMICNVRFKDGQVISLFFERTIRHSPCAQHFRPGGFEIFKIPAIVDHPHLIGFGITDADDACMRFFHAGANSHCPIAMNFLRRFSTSSA